MTDQPTPTPPEQPTPDPLYAGTAARLTELKKIATLDACLRGSLASTVRAWRDGLLTAREAVVEVEAAMRDYATNVGELS